MGQFGHAGGMVHVSRVRFVGLVVFVIAVSACSGSHRPGLVPPGTSEVERFLFDKGTAALNAKKWLTALEFFKQVVESYVQIPYLPDSQLAIVDTYICDVTAVAL